MKTRRKTLWLEALLWLAAEIVLNPSGLDILADYSEFVFQPKAAIAAEVQFVD